MAKWQTLLAAGLVATVGAWAHADDAQAQRRGRAPPVEIVNPNGPYSDATLAKFITVAGELDRLTVGTTQAERDAYTGQATEILQRNQMDPTVYNAIAAHARTDQELAQRIAALRIANLTDATLQNFVAALAEIAPISSTLAEADDTQRAQASRQIGAILSQHDLDAATYNAIATQAQTDPALAARIAALQAPPPAPAPDAGAPPHDTSAGATE